MWEEVEFYIVLFAKLDEFAIVILKRVTLSMQGPIYAFPSSKKVNDGVKQI